MRFVKVRRVDSGDAYVRADAVVMVAEMPGIRQSKVWLHGDPIPLVVEGSTGELLKLIGAIT